MKHEEVVQMSLFANLIKKYKRATPKQLMLAGVFMLAFAGAIGGGFAARSTTTAAVLRDCDNNAIMKCGAANKSEFIDKVETNNNGQNPDDQKIYAHFGLTSGQYSDFETYAQYGTFFRSDGHIEVAGKTVGTNGKSMGRQNFGGSTAYTISGAGTYYYGTPNQRWADGVTSLPVMVWFDDEGVVKAVIMMPCGNPVPFVEKKRPSYSCDALKKYAVNGKKNTYQFSADASNNDLAQVTKFTYSYNDGSGWKVFDTTTSESTKTKEITFTKASKVRVEIEVVFLNGKKKVGITSVLCEKEIGVVKEEFLHVCEALIKTPLENKAFRFNAIDKHSDNVKRLSVDFTLDGSVTAKGVTTDEDKDGFIDRTYTFSDNKTHTVSAVINFSVDGKVVQSKESCVASTEATPECKPNIPVGSKECEVMPKTGAGSVAGLFAGVAAAGAAAHRLVTSRKTRRS